MGEDQENACTFPASQLYRSTAQDKAATLIKYCIIRQDLVKFTYERYF